MIGRLVKSWRQFWCNHEFDMEQIRVIKLDNDRTASGVCRKCQVLSHAPYGLALPGRIVRSEHCRRIGEADRRKMQHDDNLNLLRRLTGTGRRKTDMVNYMDLPYAPAVCR